MRVFFTLPVLFISTLNAVVIENFKMDSQSSSASENKTLLAQLDNHIDYTTISKKQIDLNDQGESKQEEFLEKDNFDFRTADIHLTEEIALFSQTLNAILETIVEVQQDQKSLNQKIENLENHQREFMSYVHHEMSQNNHESLKDQFYEQYDYGISLMQQNKMDLALEHWQKFIENFQHTHDVSSAYYWVGEIYYVKNQDDLAKDAYLYLSEQNPQAEKASEALFKVGQICQNQGSIEQAKDYWVKLLTQYPHSSVASLAKQQLAEQELS